jgi:hypothetical protein
VVQGIPLFARRDISSLDHSIELFSKAQVRTVTILHCLTACQGQTTRKGGAQSHWPTSRRRGIWQQGCRAPTAPLTGLCAVHGQIEESHQQSRDDTPRLLGWPDHQEVHHNVVY